MAICPSGGCKATCSGGFAGGGLDYSMQISIQQTGGNTKSVASELARITGQSVVFTPSTPDDSINLDVKRARLWDVLELLSASGKIEIGGDDFAKLQRIRKALVSGERMSVCIHNTTVQRAVNEFASLSGLPIRVTSGDPKAVVSLTLKEVNLEEALTQMAGQAGVEISVK